MLNTKDTIAAIATPPGEGAIGILRLSGPESLLIAQRVFQGRKIIPMESRESNRLYVGHIQDPDSGETLDEVMLAVFRQPQTYTGEDLVEIQAHGGTFILRRILELLLRQGARLAEPGEYTRRAFLNGRMDLTQAEAVADLIKAQSSLAEKAALSQLGGGLSHTLKSYTSDLLDILAELEAHIDFPEEELPDHLYESDLEKVTSIKEKIKTLLTSARYGKAIREGVRTVLIGKPNAGKSSLLNRLLDEERAIVTPLPGTTRDTITEQVVVDGIPFVLTDTAGIRHTSDVVEKEGVRRSREAISQADLIVLILDQSRPWDEEDQTLLNLIKELAPQTPVLAALNKSDLPNQLSCQEIPSCPVVELSALTGNGLPHLRQAMANRVREGQVTDSTSTLMVTNLRHAELLEKTVADLDRVWDGLAHQVSPELISPDLRESLHHLGLITGSNATPDLLDRIFSRFCIGK